MPIQNAVSGDWSDEDEALLRDLISRRLKSKRGDKGHDIKFASDLLDGEDGETLVIGALNTGEVKRDFASGLTGNLFVEHQSWGKPSGIATTEADYWFFVLACDEYKDEVIIGIKTERLRKHLDKIKWEVRGGDSKSSKGKLIRLTKLLGRV